jgi:hypothetical protein
MRLRVAAVTALSVLALALAGVAGAAGWSSSVPFSNDVVSSPTTGGGFPDPTGAPQPGTCTSGNFNSNRSESWLAVEPGTEDLVGTSKFFFDRYSTFYNFYLGAYSLPKGKAGSNVQIPGYDCVSTGTQAMPPTWTNNTDPNVAFDTKGRAYQVTLPFNAYWTNLHPNGAIGAVYSDDLGKTWHLGNGGNYLEFLNNQSSFSFGDFQDKQWVAVDDVPTSPYVDHVYAAWAVFVGNAVHVHVAVSRDRGKTFSAPVDITMPNQTGPSVTYVYPSVDAAGDLYLAVAAFGQASGSVDADIYVTRSTDDGRTFSPFSFVAHATGNPGDFVNGNFRDGILESFAASQTYAGRLYVAYESWQPDASLPGGGQMDVKLAESQGGLIWADRGVVNDASNSSTTDQFQPEVATGPSGAVAVAFYDRRGTCPNDAGVLPQDVGAANTCIDVSLQAYKESASGLAAKVGGNVRISKYAWDASNPAQHIGGLGQMACSGVDDPCSESFIGDYFGLAISAKNVYTLSVSTHYPSGVTADEGGPVYYQQQVLATVPRNGFGSGY